MCCVCLAPSAVKEEVGNRLTDNCCAAILGFLDKEIDKIRSDENIEVDGDLESISANMACESTNMPHQAKGHPILPSSPYTAELVCALRPKSK